MYIYNNKYDYSHDPLIIGIGISAYIKENKSGKYFNTCQKTMRPSYVFLSYSLYPISNSILHSPTAMQLAILFNDSYISNS